MSNKFFLSLGITASLLLGACSTNPATGEQQFTALMSPAQEQKVGAEEHQNIIKTMGVYKNKEVQAYVNEIGQSLAKNTERPDVSYTFTVLDSPMVNAFALPGGYVYVTRGLLALANSEAELAGVIGHEIGHVTARHSAERFSQNVLASLGTAALSIALDSPDVTQMAGLGSQLYLQSYSRGQEHEADTLGIRYLHRATYDPHGMASFLNNLDQNSKLEGRIEGKDSDGYSYFSTHPRTEDRFAKASTIASQYEKIAYKPEGSYLNYLDGMVYGDSEAQGFAKGTDFYHIPMDFTFSVPDGYKIYNGANQVTALSKNEGTVVIFDAAGRENGMSAKNYVASAWLNKQPNVLVEGIKINGMNAATASFEGTVNNKPMTIRVVAVEWSADRFFRFQMAIPKGASAATLDGLKRTTYSLRHLTGQERNSLKPYRLRIVTARAGDSVQSLSSSFPYSDYREERFRVLNGMKAGEKVMPGFRYKTVID
jgi:predicted Zn-dependent protease